MTERERKSLLLSALLVLAAVCWLPAADLGTIWDDDDYVTQNAALEDLSGLRRIWFEPGATPQYYPLVFTSFWIERRLFAEPIAAHHRINVLLHVVSALLIWSILDRLSVRGAWLASALFLVHPIQVESVAWISERKNTLSLTLALASVAAWLEVRRRPRTRGLAYTAALLFYAAALLAKTVTAVLPAALLVIAWWRDGRIRRRDVIPLLPFFALGAAAAAATTWIEKNFVFKNMFELGLEPWERPLLAGRSLCFYFSKLVAPLDLSFVYPRFALRDESWILASCLGLVAATFAALFLARGRLGRGPLACALLYAGCLFPALGFFDAYPFVYSFVADHFQYHASVPMLAGLACLLATVHSRITRFASRDADGGAVPEDPGGRDGPQVSPPPEAPARDPRAACGGRTGTPGSIALGIGGCAVLVAALTWITRGYIPCFSDAETLWRSAAERNPSAILAFNNLAEIHARRGDIQGALPWAQRAAGVDERRAHPWVRAAAFVRLGRMLELDGRASESTAWYERALAVHAGYLEAYLALARRYAVTGRLKDARRVYEDALRRRPDFQAARAGLDALPPP